MESTMRGRLFTLYAWMAHPTTIHSLRMILRKLTDDDLLHLLKETNKQALTIAWAEYGRRHANVALEFEMSSLDVLTVRATDLVVASRASLVC